MDKKLIERIIKKALDNGWCGIEEETSGHQFIEFGEIMTSCLVKNYYHLINY